MERAGVSPIVATAIMALIVLGMAFGAYTFLQQGQDRVTSETERVELETINATCLPGAVTWWVNNTGDVSASTSSADLFIYDDEGLNTTLSSTGLTVQGFTDAGRHGKVETVPTKDMALGAQYTLELEVGDARLSSSCRTGADWWDGNWDYRRALHLDEPGSDVTARITIDATEPIDVGNMVAEGKLRQDCADVRIVNRGEVAAYDIRTCNPASELRIRTNLSGPVPGTAYLYYGNLQAGYANVSVDEAVTHDNPELGPEERVNLP